MFWIVVALVLLVLAFLWLKQTTVKEETLNTSSTVSMNDLLDFLCRPVNLEKYHPYFEKVTDVHETQEFVRFRIQENLGLAGKTVVPMILTTHRHSHVTAVLRLQNESKVVKVTLTMSITDNTHESPTRETQSSSSTTTTSSNTASTTGGQIKSHIKLLVRVEAPRFLNFFVHGHLVEAWTVALDKTKSLLEH